MSIEDPFKNEKQPELISEKLSDLIFRLQSSKEPASKEDNFLIEIQAIDQENSPAAKLVTQGLRYVAKKLNIPTVATADSHYPTKNDAGDHLLLLCSAMKTP